MTSKPMYFYRIPDGQPCKSCGQVLYWVTLKHDENGLCTHRPLGAIGLDLSKHKPSYERVEYTPSLFPSRVRFFVMDNDYPQVREEIVP